jgi:ankyrin repeat protein
MMSMPKPGTAVLVVALWAVCMLSAAADVSAAADDLRLIGAVQRQDAEAARALIDEGVDVNITRADGATALAWAVHWDDEGTAGLLIERGADPNRANDLAVTPLMLASTNRSAAMVERLLDAGADPNLARPNGETALLLGSRAGDVGVVRALLAHGADVTAKTSRGFTALIFAAAEGHTAVVGVLVETGADLSARTEAILPPPARPRRSRPETEGYEPLRLRKNQALVISQLNQDGDGDPRRAQGGFTPLLYAAMAGSLDTVRLLMSAGADVNESAPDGVTPLILTLTRGIEEGLWLLPGGRNEDIALFLLENGADPTLAEAGYTALHVASATGQMTAVTALIARGADPNTPVTMPKRLMEALIPGDAYLTTGWVSQIDATPFMLAAKSVDVDMMRLLLEHGADPLLTAKGGANALMLAAGLAKRHASDVGYFIWHEDQAIEAIALAMASGLDINAATDRGETALHGAVRHAAHDVMRFLVDEGADLDAVTMWNDQTALRLAQGYTYSGTYVRYPETVELLLELGADAEIGTQLNFGLTSYSDRSKSDYVDRSGNPQ